MYTIQDEIGVPDGASISIIIREYDRHSKNSIKRNRLFSKSQMSQKKYQKVRFDRDDVEVILEFPKDLNSQDAEQIKKEIKEILAGELQEKIIRSSFTEKEQVSV